MDATRGMFRWARALLPSFFSNYEGILILLVGLVKLWLSTECKTPGPTDFAHADGKKA